MIVQTHIYSVLRFVFCTFFNCQNKMELSTAKEQKWRDQWWTLCPAVNMPSWKHSTHTSYLAHGLCVVLCADLQSAHPVLPLFGIRGCETKTKKEESKNLVTIAKGQPDAASIPECHHKQQWDQYWVNLVDMGECWGLMVLLTSYISVGR